MILCRQYKSIKKYNDRKAGRGSKIMWRRDGKITFVLKVFVSSDSQSTEKRNKH